MKHGETGRAVRMQVLIEDGDDFKEIGNLMDELELLRANNRRLSAHNAQMLQELHARGWVDPQPEHPSASEIESEIGRQRVVKMQLENAARNGVTP